MSRTKSDNQNEFASVSVSKEVLDVINHAKANGTVLEQKASPTNIMRHSLSLTYPDSYRAVVDNGELAEPIVTGKKKPIQVSVLTHSFLHYVQNKTLNDALVESATLGALVDYCVMEVFSDLYPEFKAIAEKKLSETLGTQSKLVVNDNNELVQNEEDEA